MMYFTVSPSTIVALVRTNEFPYLRRSLIQSPKLSSSQSGQYAAETDLGAETHETKYEYVLFMICIHVRTVYDNARSYYTLYFKFLSYCLNQQRPSATRYPTSAAHLTYLWQVEPRSLTAAAAQQHTCHFRRSFVQNSATIVDGATQSSILCRRPCCSIDSVDVNFSLQGAVLRAFALKKLGRQKFGLVFSR